MVNGPKFIKLGQTQTHYNEELKCCRDALAYKSCSADARRHVYLVQMSHYHESVNYDARTIDPRNPGSYHNHNNHNMILLD